MRRQRKRGGNARFNSNQMCLWCGGGCPTKGKLAVTLGLAELEEEGRGFGCGKGENEGVVNVCREALGLRRKKG